MNKLTIKELAPYLPYGLKVQWIREDDNEVITSVLTISDYPFLITRNKAKPILRPLSDLTKEIVHNGERVVPVEWLEDKYYTLGLHKQCEKLAEDSRWVNHSDYLLIMHLLEWHFDIFGLIEQGLAIDINQLNNEN
jgi:hypothetical protein